MNRLTSVVWVVCGLATASVSMARDQGALAERRVTGASLFKNGLAVITEEIVVPGPGQYRVVDPPIPLYGSWWITSSARVETRAIVEEAEESAPAWEQLADLQRGLAGRVVTLMLRDEDVPLKGIVAQLGPPDESRNQWDRDYRRDARRFWFGSTSSRSARELDAQLPFLVLQRDDGTTTLIDRTTIARVDVEGDLGDAAVKVRRPVLVLDVRDVSVSGASIRISYLTKGIAWAPSYRLDLSDPEQLVLVQQAVVRNELADLTAAELRLVTGFPSVPFGHVTSPLSTTTSWSNFFQQLDQRFESSHAVTSNVLTQQAVAVPGGGGSGGRLPDPGFAADGLDLYEHSLGRRDLAEGESLAVFTGTGAAPYERIVEWVVPDPRRGDGHRVGGYPGLGQNDRPEDAPWDAVRFENPLGFPMTTGVVSIYEDGRFQGQSMTTFSNPGSPVTLRVTRALSMTTRATENERGEERGLVEIGGRTFRQVNVAGELTVRNHRQDAVTLVIRRRFSGELIEADRDPSVVLLHEGVGTVNRRNELVWTIRVPAGDESSLTYGYRVLVSH